MDFVVSLLLKIPSCMIKLDNTHTVWLMALDTLNYTIRIETIFQIKYTHCKVG